MAITQFNLSNNIYMFLQICSQLGPQGVPRHDFECIPYEISHLKRWDTSQACNPSYTFIHPLLGIWGPTRDPKMAITQAAERFQKWEFDTMVLSMSQQAWYSQKATIIIKINKIQKFERVCGTVLAVYILLIGAPIKAWWSAPIKAWRSARIKLLCKASFISHPLGI